MNWEAIEPEGTVICINRALKGAKRCDYWAAIDRPNVEHSRCIADARRLNPIVLTQKRQMPRWHAWCDLGLRTQEEAQHKGNWVQEARNGGPRYTMVSAIAWATHRGAKEIRFYGVTMSGHGYHDGPPEREAERSRSQFKETWDKRWTEARKELDQMRRIYQAASKRGILLVGLPEHATCPPSPPS